MAKAERTPGYVRLYRKLQENPIWTQRSGAVLKVFIYHLFQAHWKPWNWILDGKQVVMPAGSYRTTLRETAKECRLGVQQVRDAWQWLDRLDFSTHKATQGGTLVTIRNWESYQSEADRLQHREEHMRNTRGTRNNEEGEELQEQIPSSEALPQMQLPSMENLPFDTLDRIPKGKKPQSDPKILRCFNEEFWPLYPRRVGKGAALQSFERAAKQHGTVVILEGLHRQLDELSARESRFIPHPSTWLNQMRWEDEPPRPAPEPESPYISDEEYQRRQKERK